jgi:hypothetical protein
VSCGSVGSYADRSVLATLVDEFAEDGSAGFEVATKAEHGFGDFLRFGASEADDPDAAAAGRSGDGDDGVVEIHDWQGIAIRGRRSESL